MSSKTALSSLLGLADIHINGSRPFDIQVHDDRFYDRALRQQELGLGESYMDGWWSSQHLDETFTRMLAANLKSQLKANPAILKSVILASVFNRQTVSRAKKNAAYHYNIGNDLYERMLDKRMVYTCAYWENAKDLDTAQEAKLDLVCRKLKLEKGMTVLEIGCGWGAFAAYAAKKYGVHVTAMSPAAEQVKVAKERTKGLPVEILQKDYRDVGGTYDRVVSIGVLEHVGPKNYKTFFQLSEQRLKDDGLMLHHTIGGNKSLQTANRWIDRYIFPGGCIPSLAQLSRSVESLLVIEDLQNIGPDYDKTLMAWYQNFVRTYPEIQDKYDERFYRMWEYYLLGCAACFRARELQLWQIVMRKIRPSKTYKAVR